MIDEGKIIESYISKVAQQISDYNTFWYYGERFMYHDTSLYVNAPFQSETLNISYDGFRGGPYQQKKITDKFRVAFLGASAVLGIPYSSDSETLPCLTQKYLQKQNIDVEVLNLGVIGYNILHELNLLYKILVEYEIDAVILYSGFNDAYYASYGRLWQYEDIEDILISAFDKRRITANYHLKHALKLIIRSIKLFPYRKNLQQYLRKNRAKKLIDSTSVTSYDRAPSVYHMLLSQFIYACLTEDIKVIFVPEPNIYSSMKELSNYEMAKLKTMRLFGSNYQLSEPKIELFRQYCRDRDNKSIQLSNNCGAAVFDADKIFSNIKRNISVFFDHCHLTCEGNDILASSFAGLLRNIMK